MAELLAKQQQKPISVTRGQEIEGTVVAIFQNEIILELGTKSEGVLQKRDIPQDQLENLKIGDKLTTNVLFSENESGQVVLGVARSAKKSSPNYQKLVKFENYLKNNQVLTGKGIEVNKGGLIVEVQGVRGFLPSSQVSLSQAAKLDELVDKDILVTVIEVDPDQNRLIFSQKTNITDEVKSKLNQLKVSDEVEGDVVAVLPFGIFVTLSNGVEGLVHISEISWDKVDDPNSLFKIGDKVKAKVIAVDANSGRVNLSIKQLKSDPFGELIKDLEPDDIIKGTISKVTSQGVHVILENGAEGLVPSSKVEQETEYKAGDTKSFLVDSIDSSKRRVFLVPFITSTKDLIYK